MFDLNAMMNWGRPAAAGGTANIPYSPAYGGYGAQPPANPATVPVGDPNPAAYDPWSWEGFLGGTNQKTGMSTAGWGGMALGTLQGLTNAYLGMKQYGLAKESLDQSKEQFEQQYDAQRTLTNAQLEDRQRARLAANPGAYQSVGDYMKRNGVR